MGTKVNISIPQPCHENWQAMTIVEKGRFCELCQKNVFDFTTSSDRQIIETFKNNENLCGRFTTSQLNRDLIAPKEKSSIWLASTSALVSFLGLGSQEVFAQGEPIKTEQTDKKTVSKDENTTIFNDEKEITGYVFGDDNDLGVAEVNITIMRTSEKTVSDINGKYSITIKIGDLLVFSKPEYDEERLKIWTDTKNFNMYLSKLKKKDVMYTIGAVTVVEEKIIGERKKTFLGNIFYKIGSIFR